MSSYGNHLSINPGLAPGALNTAVLFSKEVRRVAALDHEETIRDFHDARGDLLAYADEQLEEAEQWLARNVNRHRRQIGLPTDRGLDMLDIADRAGALRAGFTQVAAAASAAAAKIIAPIKTARPAFEIELHA